MALISLKFLDGGGLEDVARSLGALADARPRLFLQKVKLHDIPSAVVRLIVNMLSEATIDDDTGRRNAIRKRIRALSRVNDPKLNGVRDDAVADLRSRLQSADP